MRFPLAVLALILLTAPATADPAWVWWEGEAAAETNFPDRSWFSADTFEEKRHEVLSGGDWLSNSGDRKGPEAFARYRIKAPAAGTYQLWVRKFWKHGPFRWRFDRAEWQTCRRDVALADSVPIRTHLMANWVHLGQVELAKGGHTFELRLLAGPGEALTAAFDCFLLTPSLFVPRGRLKPGEKSGLSEPGWWALEPEPDTFGDAALDLRSLNEEFAGKSGFVTRDGDRLLLGDGTPVRFWGVNCGPNIVGLDPGSVTYLARRLAKTGVNLVRFHGPIFDRAAKDPATVDRAFLEKLHFFVAAMKREGIYTLLSFYFPVWFPVKPSYGIEGYDAIPNKVPFSLLFFDPRMQEIYHAWARALLTTKNPHTGLPLGKDPAVAMVELVNEDSYLFHTFKPGKTIPKEQMAKLEREFGAWLAKRYGTTAKAAHVWGGAGQAGDLTREGRMVLLPAWHMTSRGHGEGAMRKRASDQLRFLVEHQRSFFDATISTFRHKYGARCLFVCGNWKTSDPGLLDALERYTYTAGDVLDQHGYFGGRHLGEGASYSVRVGNRFEDRSASADPTKIPFLTPLLEGWPHIVSEVGWTNPNRTRADGTFLCAAYGALHGLDGLCFFAVNCPDWSADSPKFPVNVPTVMGQFPGCALMFRRGDVAEADVGCRLPESLDDLYEFGGHPDWVPGRLLGDEMKSGGSYVTVDSPRCQGVCGDPPIRSRGYRMFQDAGVRFSGHGSFLAVSLDGEPIRSSGRVLLQFVSREKPYGFRTEGDRIADLGGHPLLVEDAEVAVVLKGNPRVKRASALDAHGYRKASVPIERTKDEVRLRFPRGTLYVIVE